MVKVLRNLTIKEVSSVDRGAGEGVKVVFMKRDGGEQSDAPAKKKKGVSTMAKANLNKAMEALQKSLESILGDDELEDKRAALDETVEQFHDHIAAVAAPTLAKGDTMSEELKKQVDDLTAAVAKLTEIVAEKKADPKVDPKEEEKPEDCAKAAELPEDVKKALAEADALKKSNEDMAKRLASLEDDKTQAEFEKRALDLGLAKADADVLRKAYAGDKEAIGKLETLIKGLTEQVKKGKVFAEFGAVGGPSSSEAALFAKRDELMKADSSLTKEKAFEKVYTDPKNRELVTEYKRDEAARKRAIAA